MEEHGSRTALPGANRKGGSPGEGTGVHQPPPTKRGARVPLRAARAVPHRRPGHRARDLPAGLALDPARRPDGRHQALRGRAPRPGRQRDRKSTRLNSSHVEISYAVFCLKKKKKKKLIVTLKEKKHKQNI